MFENRVRDGYVLSADVSRISIETIHRWLSTEAYWARGRSREEVERSIENSYLYAVLTADGETVACARMITDHVTFGWVSDVFVDTAHRGRGLGTWMVAEIVDHWTGTGVRRVLLATRDAHGVYAAVGFTALAHPERMMEIDRRGAF
ncbi:MAG: GNAT family N-acetyltransferase [Acidimicrobiaceae bacterium]|nr:GNAT family N-acetyltransferase [Acidimicrobiaceae bacterium]